MASVIGGLTGKIMAFYTMIPGIEHIVEDVFRGLHCTQMIINCMEPALATKYNKAPFNSPTDSITPAL